MNLIPQTREELFIDGIINNKDVPDPASRTEVYLKNIRDSVVSTLLPLARIELFLAKISGAEVYLPTPVTREELFLAKIAGMDVETPVPVTRLEWWLSEWAEQSGGTITTVTGVSPLALVNALAKPIKSLVQYGKVTTSGGDIYCNNGKLVAVDDELPSGYKRLLGITFDGNLRYETGEYLTGDDDVTMTLNNLSSTGKNVFGSYNGANDKNFSLYIYGSTNGSYFRYGDQLKRPKYGGTGQRTITFGKNGTSGFADDSEVTPDEFTTPANTYIGMLPNSSSAAFTGDIIGSITVSNRLEWIPCERESDGAIGYYEKFNGNFIAPSGSGTPVSLGYDNSHQTVLSVVGTPEVLSVGAQTASVVNLFSTGTVHDEQDIISGVVTRRTEVSVSGGEITISALSTPVTERVTAQPMRTAEGDNTISVTSNVTPVELASGYVKVKN